MKPTIAAIRVETVRTSFLESIFGLDTLFSAVVFAAAIALLITRRSKMRPAVLCIVFWQTGLCVAFNVVSMVLYALETKTDAMLTVMDWLDLSSMVTTGTAVLIFYRATDRCLDHWMAKFPVIVRVGIVAGCTVMVLGFTFLLTFLVSLALGMQNRGGGLVLFMLTTLLAASPLFLSTFYLVRLSRQYRTTGKLPNFFLSESAALSGDLLSSSETVSPRTPKSPAEITSKSFNPRWTLKWLGIFQAFLLACYMPFVFIVPAIFIYISHPGLFIVGLDLVLRSAINVFLACVYSFRPSVRTTPPTTPTPDA